MESTRSPAVSEERIRRGRKATWIRGWAQYLAGALQKAPGHPPRPGGAGSSTLDKPGPAADAARRVASRSEAEGAGQIVRKTCYSVR
jgi:hypothetical protein